MHPVCKCKHSCSTRAHPLYQSFSHVAHFHANFLSWAYTSSSLVLIIRISIYSSWMKTKSGSLLVSMAYFWEAWPFLLYQLCHWNTCIIPLILTVALSTDCTNTVHTHTLTLSLYNPFHFWWVKARTYSPCGKCLIGWNGPAKEVL